VHILAAVTTVTWFGWLVVWPYAVTLGSVVCAAAAGIYFRRSHIKRAVAFLAACLLFAASGLLIFTESEALFYGLLPDRIRPFGQFVPILLPFLLWLVGLIGLAKTLWRRLARGAIHAYYRRLSPFGGRNSHMNSIIAIHPYKAEGMWVFDDPAVGLRQEPFVSGADSIIDRMVREIPDAESGFTLLFSEEPFPGFQVEFEWRRAELSGNWYYCPALEMEGWLCPALFRYFESAPARIYAQFRPKAAKRGRYESAE